MADFLNRTPTERSVSRSTARRRFRSKARRRVLDAHEIAGATAFPHRSVTSGRLVGEMGLARSRASKMKERPLGKVVVSAFRAGMSGAYRVELSSWRLSGKSNPSEPPDVWASGTLVRFLLEGGLLDELQLLVHPIVVGSGKRLFEEGSQHVPLRLLDSKTFATGVVSLRFVPAELERSPTEESEVKRAMSSSPKNGLPNREHAAPTIPLSPRRSSTIRRSALDRSRNR